MFSDLTAEEFAACRAALDMARMLETDARKADSHADLGLAPPYGEAMSRPALAEWFATTPEDIAMVEKIALAKLANHELAFTLFCQITPPAY